MSTRRMRSKPLSQNSSSSSSSRITEDQIMDLISKLHSVVPETYHHHHHHNGRPASAANMLQETCSYIRSLHRDVDDLRERLSELLTSTDTTTAQAALIRSLLMS